MRILYRILIDVCLVFISINGFSQVQPFKSSLPLSKTYFTKIKNLVKVKESRINNNSIFELYKESEIEDESGVWEYSAIIRIDNYFFSLKLGKDQEINFADISGKDGMQEIILYQGFLNEMVSGHTFIINTLKNKPFTITDMGDSYLASFDNMIYNEFYNVDVSEYPKSKYHKDLSQIKNNGEFGMIYLSYGPEPENCRIIIKSFKITEKGIEKGKFSRKVRRECEEY